MNGLSHIIAAACLSVIYSAGCAGESHLKPAGAGRQLAIPPLDLAGVDLSFPVGTSTSQTLNGRLFVFEPVTFGGTDPLYTLQVYGDNIFVAMSCPITSAGYSVSSTTITVCGGLYLLMVTSTPNSFVFNGNAIVLPGRGRYILGTDGSWRAFH